MYSVRCDDIEHESNWICPQCQKENDKSRFLCIHEQCDYINIVEASNQKQMKCMNLQRELLFSGFIREFYLKGNIPKDITNIIDIYYPLKHGWNQSKHGENVEFMDGDTVTFSKPNDFNAKPAMVISNCIIDSKYYDKYKWKIKLLRCGYPIYLGFVVLPISDNTDWNIDTFGSLKNKNEIGIYCYEYQYGIYLTPSIQASVEGTNSASIHRRRMYMPPKSRETIQRGAVITFEIDFNAKTCYVYHQNEIISKRNKDINLYPSSDELQKDIKIVPAALVCRGSQYIIKDFDSSFF